eukprot:4457769-Ditylum_brightwellii.AAC.1
MAPIFVSICGLTEDKLPYQDCKSGVLHMQVEILCINGGNGTDNIFVPFVEHQRYMNDGWVEDDPIEDHMKVISWFDGDMAQFDTVINDSIDLYKKTKVVANKQSAAKSATEQAVDLAKVFKNSMQSKEH